MASSTIAGALSVGKGAFDRAEILRAAHRSARWHQARAFYPQPYRVFLADALRRAWAEAKQVIADAARDAALAAEEEALPPLPAAIAERIVDFREVFAGIAATPIAA